MNISELEQLVTLVQNANIHELTLRQDGARVTIRKSPPVPVTYVGETGAELAEETEAGNASQLGSDAEDLPETDGMVPVTSPLVGTFRPAKTAVALGAAVTSGQVIGIIEAMKLPNDVTAPCAGKVVELFVENGQFVEYGQELFAIEPRN